MPHVPTNTVDSDIAVFSTIPPPPYPGAEHGGVDSSQYDLTPIPQNQNRPRLPDEKRNPHLRNRESKNQLSHLLELTFWQCPTM